MNLYTDPPAMHTCANNLHELSGEYTNVYKRLLNSANTMGEAWKAADNLAFVDQINGLCQDLKNMADHLEQASKALNAQATNYETTRDNNVTGVKTLAN